MPEKHTSESEGKTFGVLDSITIELLRYRVQNGKRIWIDYPSPRVVTDPMADLI